ncbi:MAG: hypothetical protein CVU84_09105 [Firmicutes bacterium HGW-Firmicutes-1]|jgi:uncharacterized protein|nr:MAG: hypothetical protein CVU84_09105 [Firmicutes bacterium HGW-Firmicutes-1]
MINDMFDFISAPPYIALYNTPDGHYVLDHHTNRLFEISESESEVFSRWLSGTSLTDLQLQFSEIVSEIKTMIERGLFSCNPPQYLSFHASWPEIITLINSKRAKTLVEITDKCNLRCKYCAFGGGYSDHRTHGNLEMSTVILEKAILEAIQCSQESERISIGFYGGEPLLAFEKIKYAVFFAKTHSLRPISFSITTNATLINFEIAQFLNDHSFNVLVSLDGPKDMHDRFRQYPNGTGSYETTINGLKTLLDIYPSERHNLIGLNMVIPSLSWLSQLHQLWDQESWLPRNIRAQTSLVDAPEHFIFEEPPHKGIDMSLYDEWLSEIRIEKKNTLLENMFDKSYLFFHQRPTFSGHRNSFYPNGCCVPAVQKLYVSVEGHYKICERVHGCPNIGHALTGIDLLNIQNVIAEYAEKSFEDCQSCVAISNCTLCYLHAYENGLFNQDKKRINCEKVRRSFNQKIADYISISKTYPEKIQEWDNATIY